MPAIYAHLRFGDKVAETLPPSFKECIGKYPEAFHLGTQGPDVLFYHKPMKKNAVRTHGMALHKECSPTKFFQAAGKHILDSNGVENGVPTNALAAYICGFLCHFTLDISCHPYIDANSSEALTHGKIESEFDKFILKKDGKAIRGYNTATPICGENGAKEAAHTTLNVENFGVEVPEEAVARSIKTMRGINRLFSYPFEPFHGFAHFFLKIVKMERKFGDMFLHKKDDPLAAPLNAPLYERLENAVPTAKALIEDYFARLRDSVARGKFDNPIFLHDYSGITTYTEV